jgi:hypothetical protein
MQAQRLDQLGLIGLGLICFTDNILAILGCDLTVGDLLKFITGVRKIPPLGLPKKITVYFIHECHDDRCKCRPKASTCDLHLRLPVHYQTSEGMTSAWVSALKECKGFGHI